MLTNFGLLLNIYIYYDFEQNNLTNDFVFLYILCFYLQEIKYTKLIEWKNIYVEYNE